MGFFDYVLVCITHYAQNDNIFVISTDRRERRDLLQLSIWLRCLRSRSLAFTPSRHDNYNTVLRKVDMTSLFVILNEVKRVERSPKAKHCQPQYFYNYLTIIIQMA